MAARVIPSREIFSITIRADGCVSLGSPRFSAPHFPSSSPSCSASPCLALSFAFAFLCGLCPFLFSLFPLLFFSFLFFRCFSSPADSGNFFSFRGASRCPQPVDKLLLHAPRLWALLCFGAASSGAATLQVSLYSRPDLKAPSALGHLLARNAQLISACAAPPSNCI